MKNYTKIFFILILTSCTYGPTGYNYWYVPTMEKNARQKGNTFHVVAFSPFKDTPWMGSSSLNYDEAESIAMRRCRANANDCYIYLKKYVSYDPHAGRYSYKKKKIIKKTKNVSKKKKTISKKKKSKPPNEKDENLTDEQIWSKITKTLYEGRDLKDLEGIWGYKKKEEEEARIYALIKSDNFLYKEIVLFHPIREFEGKISTKITKKINKNKFEMKAGFGSKSTKWRDGLLTIITKRKLKFEANEHCYSAEQECLKAYSYYKIKIWPEETYGEKTNLTEVQINKLKDLIN